MNKKIERLTGLVLVAISCTTSAEDWSLRNLAASCSACHASSGQAAPGMQTLAGQAREDLLQKLRDFKADSKPGTLMPQLARGYSDAQLTQLAGYFAGLKP